MREERDLLSKTGGLFLKGSRKTVSSPQLCEAWGEAVYRREYGPHQILISWCLDAQLPASRTKSLELNLLWCHENTPLGTKMEMGIKSRQLLNKYIQWWRQLWD